MFQILTSVLREHPIVMLMLSALTPMGHIPAFVSLGIVEMERNVKVRILIVLRIQESGSSTVERFKLF